MKTIKVYKISDVPEKFTGIIEDTSKTKYWCLNGKRHRLDGPAMECLDGTKKWYQYGKLHRLDGPAVIFYDGTEEYWINNISYPKKVFKERMLLIKKMIKTKEFKNFKKTHTVEQINTYINFLACGKIT